MLLRTFLLTLFFCFFIACEGKKSEEDLNNTRNSSLEQGEKLNFNLTLNDGKEFFIKAQEQKLEFDSGQKATLFFFCGGKWKKKFLHQSTADRAGYKSDK